MFSSIQLNMKMLPFCSATPCYSPSSQVYFYPVTVCFFFFSFAFGKSLITVNLFVIADSLIRGTSISMSNSKGF